MKYRKKPVVIEAVQWLGYNFSEILRLSAEGGRDICQEVFDDYLTIKTLEGDMKANINDWVIKGVSGEVYPCKPDIFELTYEKAE